MDVNSWNHISIIEIGQYKESVHCDTRDFFVAFGNRVYTKEKDKEVYRLLHGSKINEKFLIRRHEILPWLMEMERISGGRNKWRCLNFSHITTAKGWLKYIRFYRYKDDAFVVCDDYYNPIDWRQCNEQTIDKECLNAHS